MTGPREYVTTGIYPETAEKLRRLKKRKGKLIARLIADAVELLEAEEKGAKARRKLGSESRATRNGAKG